MSDEKKEGATSKVDEIIVAIKKSTTSGEDLFNETGKIKIKITALTNEAKSELVKKIFNEKEKFNELVLDYFRKNFKEDWNKFNSETRPLRSASAPSMSAAAKATEQTTRPRFTSEPLMKIRPDLLQSPFEEPNPEPAQTKTPEVAVKADEKTEEEKAETVEPKYSVHTSQENMDAVKKYQEDLIAGKAEMGAKLKAVVGDRDIKSLTTEQFLELIIQTKEPKFLAEGAYKGGGKDWNAREAWILGNINIAVPVTIFDDGQRPTQNNTVSHIQVHDKPFQGTLLYTPGALLAKGEASEDTPDMKELIKSDGNIDDDAYYKLYERRLLPLLLHANDEAGKEKVKAFFAIPGIGCGAFAGKFKGQLEEKFEGVLRKILINHVDKLPNIKGVLYDPFQGKANKDEKIGNIDFLVRPTQADPNNKPQLSRPEAHGAEYAKCKLFAFVAWDHFSCPGNEGLAITRGHTDDSAKTMATDAAEKVTGVKGNYDSAQRRFMPPDISEYHEATKDGILTDDVTWRKVIEAEKIKLEVGDRLIVTPTPKTNMSESFFSALTKEADDTKAAEAAKAMENQAQIDKMFEKNKDPFSISPLNVRQAMANYKAIYQLGIDAVVNFILANPEHAEVFFEKRNLTTGLGAWNFREALGERPDLIEKLINAEKPEILDAIEKTNLLSTSHIEDESKRSELNQKLIIQKDRHRFAFTKDTPIALLDVDSTLLPANVGGKPNLALIAALKSQGITKVILFTSSPASEITKQVRDHMTRSEAIQLLKDNGIEVVETVISSSPYSEQTQPLGTYYRNNYRPVEQELMENKDLLNPEKQPQSLKSLDEKERTEEAQAFERGMHDKEAILRHTLARLPEGAIVFSLDDKKGVIDTVTKVAKEESTLSRNIRLGGIQVDMDPEVRIRLLQKRIEEKIKKIASEKDPKEIQRLQRLLKNDEKELEEVKEEVKPIVERNSKEGLAQQIKDFTEGKPTLAAIAAEEEKEKQKEVAPMLSKPATPPRPKTPTPSIERVFEIHLFEILQKLQPSLDEKAINQKVRYVIAFLNQGEIPISEISKISKERLEIVVKDSLEGNIVEASKLAGKLNLEVRPQLATNINQFIIEKTELDPELAKLTSEEKTAPNEDILVSEIDLEREEFVESEEIKNVFEEMFHEAKPAAPIADEMKAAEGGATTAAEKTEAPADEKKVEKTATPSRPRYKHVFEERLLREGILVLASSRNKATDVNKAPPLPLEVNSSSSLESLVNNYNQLKKLYDHLFKQLSHTDQHSFEEGTLLYRNGLSDLIAQKKEELIQKIEAAKTSGDLKTVRACLEILDKNQRYPELYPNLNARVMDKLVGFKEEEKDSQSLDTDSDESDEDAQETIRTMGDEAATSTNEGSKPVEKPKPARPDTPAPIHLSTSQEEAANNLAGRTSVVTSEAVSPILAQNKKPPKYIEIKPLEEFNNPTPTQKESATFSFGALLKQALDFIKSAVKRSDKAIETASALHNDSVKIENLNGDKAAKKEFEEDIKQLTKIAKALVLIKDIGIQQITPAEEKFIKIVNEFKKDPTTSKLLEINNDKDFRQIFINAGNKNRTLSEAEIQDKDQKAEASESSGRSRKLSNPGN
jgi:hypothetical protein